MHDTVLRVFWCHKSDFVLDWFWFMRGTSFIYRTHVRGFSMWVYTCDRSSRFHKKRRKEKLELTQFSRSRRKDWQSEFEPPLSVLSSTAFVYLSKSVRFISSCSFGCCIFARRRTRMYVYDILHKSPGRKWATCDFERRGIATILLYNLCKKERKVCRTFIFTHESRLW